ncbi:MAG: hypothetical protein O7G85_04140, partial [Planctomycetota bacterium]|nr:hypothetical protein [Planctomycetota bacterium]
DECEVDCNANGVPDECDLTSGTSPDCNTHGIPDECEEDCNTNGLPESCDLAAGTDFDCNANGLLDDCDIKLHVRSDCNENGIPDDCDIASGLSLDRNSDGYPDDCLCDERQMILSPQIIDNMKFGKEVDLDGEYAVVGNGTEQPVTVLRMTGGVWEVYDLLSSPSPTGVEFGKSVAIGGNFIAVSEFDDGAGEPMIHVYQRTGSTWGFLVTLRDASFSHVPVRGRVLSIDQDVLAVRIIPRDTSIAPGFDGALIYRFVGGVWTLDDRIAMPAPVTDISYNNYVDLSGNVLVVTHDNPDVLVYRYDPILKQWNLEADLSSHFLVNSFFLYEVAIDQDVIAVGEYIDSDSSPRHDLSTGRVLVFRHDSSNWNLEDILYPANSIGFLDIDHFGVALDVEQDRLIVLSDGVKQYPPPNGENLLRGGMVYTYQFDGVRWNNEGAVIQRKHPLDPFGNGDVNFKDTIAMSGDQVIVGAKDTWDGLDPWDGTDQPGAVYVLTGLFNPDTDGNGLPDDCEFVIGDTDGDGLVGVFDLLDVLASWGDCANCPADFNGDFVVDVLDLLFLLSRWS